MAPVFRFNNLRFLGIMKRLVLLVVVALGMSATSFAGEKVAGKDWKVDVNVAKLSKYLNLDARQMEEVANISDYFADNVQSASYATEAKQGKKLREAVYGNFKLMKRTLTNEQYKKYVQVLNVTLKNKGLDSYMEDVANK